MAAPLLRERARRLRRKQTPAERLLWSNLRASQLAGFKFRRQYPFGHFILDFYCLKAHLAIEVDGGQHGEEENLERDAARTEYLASHGIRVIRFWNHEVLDQIDDVITEIHATLEDIKLKED